MQTEPEHRAILDSLLTGGLISREEHARAIESATPLPQPTATEPPPPSARALEVSPIPETSFTRLTLTIIGVVAGIVVVILIATFAILSMQPKVTPSNYASDFATDYNDMLQVDNADIRKQNSGVYATAVAGIKARVAVHQNFDALVEGIQFPSSASADVNRVLATDAALEKSLTKLAANRTNARDYNAVFDTVQPLQAAFTAAAAKLGRD